MDWLVSLKCLFVVEIRLVFEVLDLVEEWGNRTRLLFLLISFVHVRLQMTGVSNLEVMFWSYGEPGRNEDADANAVVESAARY